MITILDANIRFERCVMRLLAFVVVLVFGICCFSFVVQAFKNESVLCCTNGSDFADIKYDMQKVRLCSDISIPDRYHNFVPQGIAYWEAQSVILVSGYYKPVSAIRTGSIFVLDATSGNILGDICVLQGFGKMYSGHYGGIAVSNDVLFMTGGNYLHFIELEKLPLKGHGCVKIHKSIPIPIAAATCAFYNDTLWIANCVLENETYNSGKIIGYRVNAEMLLEPLAVFYSPCKIQGISVSENRFILSCSYGKYSSSSIILYSDPRKENVFGYEIVERNKVPIWLFGDETKITTITIPPMAEGCYEIGNELLILFESGAYVYNKMRPWNSTSNPINSIWHIKLS